LRIQIKGIIFPAPDFEPHSYRVDKNPGFIKKTSLGGFFGFYWVFLGFDCFFLGFVGFYWILLGFIVFFSLYF